MLRRRRFDLGATAGWALALTLVGYPVAGLISSALDWESTVASIPFRLGVLAVSAVLWLKSPPLTSLIRRAPWLVAFTFLYVLRLTWDIAVAGVPGASSALGFYVITVLIPVVPLALAAAYLREDQAAWAIALTGGVACTLAMVFYVMDWGTDRSLTEATQRLSFEAVNPITIGHTAVTTVIASLAVGRCSSRALLAPLVLVVAAAFACLVLSASRGPLLALAACALAYFAVAGGWRLRLLLAIGLAFGSLVVGSLVDEPQLLLRFADLDDDPSSLLRLLLQSNAISQFAASPLFGSAFAELEFFDYPHNLFIETAMALGVVGLVVMVRLVYLAATEFMRRIRAGQILLPLLLLQYVIAIQLSGALWGASAFWALLAIMIASRHAALMPLLRRRSGSLIRVRSRTSMATERDG